MVLLWSGNVSDENDAFQLLHIMDIVRFWAESIYKPIICACLRRIHDLRQEAIPTSLEQTTWSLQFDLKRETPPWLFTRMEDNEQRLVSASRKLNKQNLSRASSTLSSISQRSVTWAQTQTISRSIPQPFRRRLRSTKRQLMLPESEQYNWFLDRSCDRGDHIMIRLRANGEMFSPVIFFDPPEVTLEDWHDLTFMRILHNEKHRYPHQVSKAARMYEPLSRHIWPCRHKILHYIEPDAQLCIVLSLDHSQYSQRIEKEEDEKLFEPIEDLLNLDDLLQSFRGANDRWCSCGRLPNESNSRWIQCSNARCALEWYHRECVGLDVIHVSSSPNLGSQRSRI